MNWKDRVIRDEDLHPFLPDPTGADIPSLIQALISQQTASWPLLDQGIQALEHVSTKSIPLGPFEVVAQFNPGRIASTSAAVDTTSVRKRPCFLCHHNLPLEEKGIPYGEDYVILCNPFPVLRQHVTIVHREHIEQAIAGHFTTILDLARDLSPGFFILYNGPQCGASAPDHFHLQAGSRKGLPLEDHLAIIFRQTELAGGRRDILGTEGAELLSLEEYHLRALVFHGANREAIIRWFVSTLAILSDIAGGATEPLINVVATYNAPAWRVTLFPRAKHRPDCYFATGESQLLVSPGAIDLAGWVVVPVESHFQKIESGAVRRIFTEVTAKADAFSNLVGRLRRSETGHGHPLVWL